MDAKQHRDLNSYISSMRNVPFELGVHDCFTFTNRAWSVLYGKGYAEDWLGRYAGLGPKAFHAAMIDSFGTSDLHKALDAGLRRCDRLIPPKGALVTSDKVERYYTGQGFGIALGTTAAFVGDQHLLYLPIEMITGAWVPCHS